MRKRQLSYYGFSFGYKYGVPIDADNIVDVRFLKNPFYINELREKTGQDNEVYEFVFEDKNYSRILWKISRAYDFHGR